MVKLCIHLSLCTLFSWASEQVVGPADVSADGKANAWAPSETTLLEEQFLHVCIINFTDICDISLYVHVFLTRRGGVEVAGWTVDWDIPVRFPAYPHRMLAL